MTSSESHEQVHKEIEMREYIKQACYLKKKKIVLSVYEEYLCHNLASWQDSPPDCALI